MRPYYIAHDSHLMAHVTEGRECILGFAQNLHDSLEWLGQAGVYEEGLGRSPVNPEYLAGYAARMVAEVIGTVTEEAAFRWVVAGGRLEVPAASFVWQDHDTLTTRVARKASTDLAQWQLAQV